MWIAYRIIILLSISIITQTIHSQQLISINNGSFENVELANYEGFKYSKAIGWKSGDYFKFESPVTVHVPGIIEFGVRSEASDGDNFISMVTRENETWEGISQKLSESLQKNKRYRMSFSLSWFERMYGIIVQGASRFDNAHQNEFKSKPVVVNVWFDTRHCDQRSNDNGQLVWTSTGIDHEEWIDYEVEFLANNAHKWIFIEVYFVEENGVLSEPYFGNVLIDNISDILEVLE